MGFTARLGYSYSQPGNLEPGYVSTQQGSWAVTGVSVTAVFPPDVTHNFPPAKLPTSSLPVVRSIPQPVPTHHVTIARPASAIQTGPTTKVSVKR